MVLVLPLVALSAVSLFTGYYFGKLYGTSTEKGEGKTLDVKPHDTVEEEGQEEDDDEGDVADGDLSTVQAGLMEPCKMVRE